MTITYDEFPLAVFRLPKNKLNYLPSSWIKIIFEFHQVWHFDHHNYLRWIFCSGLPNISNWQEKYSFHIEKEVVQNPDKKKFKALIKYHENENKNSITHSKQLFIGNMLYVSPESA